MNESCPMNGKLRWKGRRGRIQRRRAFLPISITVSVWFIWKLYAINPLISKSWTRQEGEGLKTFKFYDYGRSYHDLNFSCPVQWEWVSDPTKADAVWYNVLDHSPKIAKRLHNDQKLVWYTLESLTAKKQLNIKSQFGFDYMVDYRIWPENPNSLADIPAVYMLNPTAPGLVENFRIPPPLPKRDDAYVAAFISNCYAKNNRATVLKELMQHINVHSYGRCMHNADEPPSVPGETKFAKKKKIAGGYYFMFTAENTNEDSYVTEKVYHAFTAGAVPIYMGAPDINRFIPDPMSIINVADFNSTSDLAAYLLKLIEDPDEYMKHFEWKRKEFSDDFTRVLRLASRTVQCRLAMQMAGLDFEEGLRDFDMSNVFPLKA